VQYTKEKTGCLGH